MWIRTMALAAFLTSAACQATDPQRENKTDPIENPPLTAKTEDTHTVRPEQPIEPAANQKRYVGASVDAFGAT